MSRVVFDGLSPTVVIQLINLIAIVIALAAGTCYKLFALELQRWKIIKGERIVFPYGTSLFGLRAYFKFVKHPHRSYWAVAGILIVFFFPKALEQLVDSQLRFETRDGDRRIVTSVGHVPGGPLGNSMLGEDIFVLQLQESLALSQGTIDIARRNGLKTKRFIEALQITSNLIGFEGAETSSEIKSGAFECQRSLKPQVNVAIHDRELIKCFGAHSSFSGVAVSSTLTNPDERVFRSEQLGNYTAELIGMYRISATPVEHNPAVFSSTPGEGNKLQFQDRIFTINDSFVLGVGAFGPLEGLLALGPVISEPRGGWIVVHFNQERTKDILKQLSKLEHHDAIDDGRARLTGVIPALCESVPYSNATNRLLSASPEEGFELVRSLESPECSAFVLFLLLEVHSKLELPKLPRAGLSLHFASQRFSPLEQDASVELTRSLLTARLEASALIDVEVVRTAIRATLPISVLVVFLGIFASMSFLGALIVLSMFLRRNAVIGDFFIPWEAFEVHAFHAKRLPILCRSPSQLSSEVYNVSLGLDRSCKLVMTTNPQPYQQTKAAIELSQAQDIEEGPPENI